MSDAFVGEIRLFSYTIIPRGWLLCNGAVMQIQPNAALYSLLGTQFGGDGKTTFALPDLRGRLPVGCGQGTGLSAYILGATFGVEQVTLTAATFPVHTHAFVATTNAATSLAPTPNGTMTLADVGAGNELYTAPNVPSSTPAVLNAMSTSKAGNSVPHDNLQHVMAMNYIICCLGGLFPST